MRLAVLLLMFPMLYAEPVPEDSLKALLGKVLSVTEGKLAEPRPLPDFSHRINTLLFGFIPIHLELSWQNVSIVGPSHIQTVQGIRGEKSPDGKSLFLQTRIKLTDIIIKYEYIVVDFFGYRYETVGEMTKHFSRSDVSLRFEPEGVLEGCLRTISSVTEPNGPITITFGQPGTILYDLTFAIQFVLVYYSNSKFEDGQYLFSIFFPSVQEVIMSIMDSYKVNC